MKGNLKGVFLFIPVTILFVGILIIPVNAASDAMEPADTVSIALSAPNILSVDFTTQSAIVSAPSVVSAPSAVATTPSAVISAPSAVVSAPSAVSSTPSAVVSVPSAVSSTPSAVAGPETAESVIVPAEPAVAAPAEAFVEIMDEDIPTAPVENLPQTGGIPAGVFYVFGGLVTTAGLLLRIKK